jgi:hypothetical protein
MTIQPPLKINNQAGISAARSQKSGEMPDQSFVRALGCRIGRHDPHGRARHKRGEQHDARALAEQR